jgi:hypothetical protein
VQIYDGDPNLKKQNNKVVDVCGWSRNGGMLPFSINGNSLINEFAQQGMCMEIFKGRSMRLLVVICSRILISLFIACINPLLSNGKEMNRYEMRFFVDTNDVLATSLVEILMPIWNALMVSLEGVEIGFALGMIPLNAVIQWDLGETNILMFMLINLYECCWKSFSSLYTVG